MRRPDFARTELTRLEDRDLRFLVENFPLPGRSYEEIARVVDELPTTFESALDSEWVVRKILDEQTSLLRVSPFLLFNVLLRQALPDVRGRTERRVVNYLANLLTLFVRSDRVRRVEEGESESYEYLVDLIEEAARADFRRRFLVNAHIGNTALYWTGLFAPSIEYRRRYRKRPVLASDYADLGTAGFREAAAHPLAEQYGLDAVFLRLALMFDHYRDALERLSERYLARA